MRSVCADADSSIPRRDTRRLGRSGFDRKWDSRARTASLRRRAMHDASESHCIGSSASARGRLFCSNKLASARLHPVALIRMRRRRLRSTRNLHAPSVAASRTNRVRTARSRRCTSARRTAGRARLPACRTTRGRPAQSAAPTRRSRGVVEPRSWRIIASSRGRSSFSTKVASISVSFVDCPERSSENRPRISGAISNSRA